MSDLRVNSLRGRTAGSAPNLPNGAVSTGIITATSFDGNLTGNNVVVGIASASQFKGPDGTTAFFYGDGSGLINVSSSSITGINIKNNNNVIGAAGTINFGANLDVSPVSAGIVTVTEASYTTTATSTGKTLINREYCTVTAAGQTITLPATPNEGDEVGIQVGNFTDTVVARNGSNIMALAEDFTMDIAYLAVQLVYIDATQGWRFI